MKKHHIVLLVLQVMHSFIIIQDYVLEEAKNVIIVTLMKKIIQLKNVMKLVQHVIKEEIIPHLIVQDVLKVITLFIMFQDYVSLKEINVQIAS